MAKIILDKERNITFDLNAMVKYEVATGKSLFKQDISKEMSASDMRALLFAGLSSDDKTLTIEQVGALITIENMAQVAEVLAKSLSQGNDGKVPLSENGPSASTISTSPTSSSGG